jgi:hypothetical protein
MKQLKCYANHYDNCTDKMSAEHPLSHNILKLIDSAGTGEVRVVGAPWLKGESKLIPTPVLVANVLCTGHNKALSPLDKEAGRFFEAMCTAEDILLSKRKRPQHASHRFSGDLLERWMMKVLCGFAVSGNLRDKVKFMPPQDWVDFIFGKKVFPPGRGGLFYGWAEGTEKQDQGRHAGVHLISSEFGPCGIKVELNAHSFTLTTSQPIPAYRKEVGSFMPVKGYRPAQLVCTDGVSERTFYLDWAVPGENARIVLGFNAK